MPPLTPWPSRAWGYVLAAGVAAYAAEVCITLGFARVGQNVLGQVSVLKFLSPIFALLWGVVFLGERPAWHVLVGAVLVLCPAAFVAYDRQAAVKQQGSEDQADECGTSRTLENEGDALAGVVAASSSSRSSATSSASSDTD